MITVETILSYLETLAPASMKMEWDNVGLLCGSKKTVVSKVLVAWQESRNSHPYLSFQKQLLLFLRGAHGALLHRNLHQHSQACLQEFL